jgi:hypothetical protein
MVFQHKKEEREDGEKSHKEEIRNLKLSHNIGTI